MTDTALAERVSTLEGGQEQVLAELKRLNRSIESISGGQRTQWGPMISGAAVILALVGMGMGGVQQDTGRIEADLRDASKELREHTSQRAHTAAEGELEALRAELVSTAYRGTVALERLDTDLQREMRDLDTVIAAAIKALDANLQREMDNKDKLLSTEMHWIKESLGTITEWVATQTATLAAHDERIKQAETRL